MLQRTKIGKAMRAVADNPDLAASSGIDVEPGHPGRLGRWAARSPPRRRAVALNDQVQCHMGFNLLLLMFAGITLGGLGTAYGALVGSSSSACSSSVDARDPEDMKNVGALLLLIVILVIRPQGIFGSRTDRLRPWTDLLNASRSRCESALGFQAIFFALPAIGLNIHFGYTGLLNFGQVAFMAVGAYGIAIVGGAAGAAASGSASSSVCCRGGARPPARHPDPATAGRLPRHRDDRGRRRSCGCVSDRCPPPRITGGTRGLQRFDRDFYRRSTPWTPAAGYRVFRLN